MALRPSSVPLRVPLPPPPESSLPAVLDPESDLTRAASPTVTRLLATVVTDPSFESTAASNLVAELVDFAAACRLDYATSLVVEFESESNCPPSVGGECAVGTNVLEDRQEDFEFLAATVPHLVAMLLAPEGDPDAPDIPTPRSYAEAITGPYSSQWQIAMDAKIASWKSTGAYVDEVPPPGANIVNGMWIFRGSQHEEIWLRRPPCFTGSFPAGTQWSLRRPVYCLRQAPREWQDTLRTTLAALGFAPSTTDPSLFLRTDTSLPSFYVLVYVDDLVFAIADTEALAFVKSKLSPGIEHGAPSPRLSHTWCTRSFNASASCNLRHSPLLCLPVTRSQLHLRTSPIFARYVAPGRHRPEHWEAAKRVRYLGSTSGMGLMLGGRGPVVLTGHADASWFDGLATQRSSQGYTFSLGSGSVSWRSTRSSSVLSSSCEAEIYAGAMAAQELRWLTYLLTDLGERPRSSPVLTKHITLRYFLAQDLQQRGQLHLACMATRANIADIFTKALQSACFAFLD
ncbi:unnamed protein product [Closterium sp. NIES-53]